MYSPFPSDENILTSEEATVEEEEAIFRATEMPESSIPQYLQ